jgi:PAS domain-containing protein
MLRIPAIAPFVSLISQLRRRRWRFFRSLRSDRASAFDTTDRKRIDDVLRQSEAKYRAIFENAAVGIALLKPDGSWVQVNDRLLSFWATPPTSSNG